MSRAHTIHVNRGASRPRKRKTLRTPADVSVRIARLSESMEITENTLIVYILRQWLDKHDAG